MTSDVRRAFRRTRWVPSAKEVAVATLVERWSRFLLLIKLDSIRSEAVVAALAEHVLTLPEQLRRSLTWDQGKEMGCTPVHHHWIAGNRDMQSDQPK